MKNIRWSALALGALLLAACGDDETVTNAPQEAPTEQNDDNNNANSGNVELAENAPFDFTSFSLDVNYSPTESYEVEYENETTGMEASIEDLDNKKITGNDAYAQLEPIFTNFTFDVTTANDEVVAEVLKAFGLADNYRQFELEIRFADGAEKEYRVNK